MTADRDGAAIRAAALVSGAMIAFQVGSRATRDALFLSTFDVTSLPAMIAFTSVTAVAAVLAASRPMARFGPGRAVPALFFLSAALMLVEWTLVRPVPRAAAVLVYLHFGGLGALLVSGFWSVVNERFDPRTARRVVGHIAAAGTVGGLVGGLVAERAAVLLSVAAMLPILAAIHVACGAVLLRVRAPAGATASPAEPAAPASWTAGLRAIGATPFLRTLVAVVLLATLAEGLIDYVFKAQARAAYGRGPELLRLFALFYTGVSLLSVIVQTGLSRAALERYGLARTVGLLPWITAAGGAGALAVPGLASAMLARGAEAVVRNSLYRSGYEVLFTPLTPQVKRAAKPLVDVGVLRTGDIVAAGLVQAVLFLLPGSALTALLMFAVAFAAAGIAITYTVHAGYVTALERSLLSHAVRLELDDVQDSTTRTTLMHTVGAVPRVAAPAAPDEAPVPDVGVTTLPPPDPVVGRVTALRSRDPQRVRRALTSRPLEAADVPHALALLAWDEVGADALRALQAVAGRHTGQCVDALLDPDEDFTIRRRIPAVLVHARNPRAVEGLLAGLADRRFEVRFRCGRALARLVAADPALRVAPERVYDAVLREVAVDRQVWEGQRLLDTVEDDAEAGFVDEVLRERASRGLEHVFTVLSLILPREPLAIAFRGLHADDRQLRGTALEYLDASLPEPVREKLWPFLDDRPRPPAPARAREAIVADLLRSNESIALNLAAQRRSAGA